MPVNPVGTNPAEAACVELTEDEDAFIVVGFLLDDAVLCPLETHETAVIGGAMTPERLERARAPWVSNEAGTDLQSEAITALAEAGEFDGTLGVFAGPGEEAQLNDVALPQLEELGVEVAESAVVDAPSDDIAAGNAAVGTIAERFESAGVDQVLTLGTAGLAWATGTETSTTAPSCCSPTPTRSSRMPPTPPAATSSALDGAVAGNLYGPDENIYDLPAMQDCIDVIDAAGGEPITDPSTLAPDEDGNHVAAFTACNQVAILRALLEAAGEDLNYGSLAAALDEGVEVQVPGDPEPVTYGAPPAADGDRPAYVFDWDPDEVDFVLRED